MLSFVFSFVRRCIVIQLNSRQIALKISRRWVGRFGCKIEGVDEEIDVLDNQLLTKTKRKGMESCAAFLRVSHCVLRNFTPCDHEKREVKRLRTRGEKTRDTG